eukprot:9865462-Prorocentrum_lima.AAC.1
MLEDGEVPALLGVRTIEGKNRVIDKSACEQNMYMRENPKDIIFSIREGRNMHMPSNLRKHFLVAC